MKQVELAFLSVSFPHLSYLSTMGYVSKWFSSLPPCLPQSRKLVTLPSRPAFIPLPSMSCCLSSRLLLTSVTRSHFLLQNLLTLNDSHLGHLSVSMKSSEMGDKTNSRMHLRQNCFLFHQTCYNSL